MPQFLWTSEAVEILIKLWNEKKTGSFIAKEIGISRGSVMGKINRLGLLRKNQNTNPVRIVKKPVEYIKPEYDKKRIGITLDLTNHSTCMYPTTNSKPFLYCGKKVCEGVYCKKHAALCLVVGNSAVNYEKQMKYWAG